MSERSRGLIKWFSHQRGYGFIQRRDGRPDVFVHANDFRNPPDVHWLVEGNAVEFEVRQAPKGPRAVDVLVLGR
jgi:CspA family cold shock protein